MKKICENCGKTHDGSYGSGRFCSSFCARSFSTKNKKNDTKLVFCINCGKGIYVGKNANSAKCKCEDCRKKSKRNIRYCKICGRTYYKSDGGCLNLFCRNHNINQINTLVKYFNFDKNKVGTVLVEEEFNRVRENLYDLYWNCNLSSADLGKLFNYKNSHNIVQQIFRYLDIPVRSCRESTINAYLTGKRDALDVKNKYKSCWHTTWEGKEVYLRSSYELDFAKELDEQKIKYEVESLKIKYLNTKLNEYRCAIPYFYLPDSNTIVEIKSAWTLDVQNMKDKAIEYQNRGYSFRLICDHKELNIDFL